jgi:DNA-binding GntR family transcriptional regulator
MARYHEVAQDLRRRIIVEHEYEIGDRLPSISELQERYGERSLNTIRKAQQLLVREGLLRTEQGVGSWVVANERQVDVLAELVDIRDRLDRLIATYTHQGAPDSKPGQKR